MKRVFLTLLLILVTSCTKVVETPTSPAPTPTTPAPPPVVVDKIDFRVFGEQLLNPINIQFTDPVNGTTFVSGTTPYFVTVTSKQDNVFLFIEAKGFGTNSQASTLQVQIFVNGALFREGISSGSTLLASASGTYRRP